MAAATMGDDPANSADQANGADSPDNARRARPRLVGERLDQLLDIAAEVFIADGFQAASTNLIAQRAGASKASLYARFPSKEELFLAVLERRMAQIFLTVVASIAPQAPLRAALYAFGTQFSQLVLNQAHIALVRMVCMESARFPQLGQRFFALGPGRGVALLAGYIETQIARGTLRAHDAALMAQQFLGMIGGFPLLVGLLGLAGDMETAATRNQRLQAAIDTFIAAHSTVQQRV